MITLGKPTRQQISVIRKRLNDKTIGAISYNEEAEVFEVKVDDPSVLKTGHYTLEYIDADCNPLSTFTQIGEFEITL